MINYGTFLGDKASLRHLFEAGLIYINMNGIFALPQHGEVEMRGSSITFIYFKERQNNNREKAALSLE